jgi:hypothetical protein
VPAPFLYSRSSVNHVNLDGAIEQWLQKSQRVFGSSERRSVLRLACSDVDTFSRNSTRNNHDRPLIGRTEITVVIIDEASLARYEAFVYHGAQIT